MAPLLPPTTGISAGELSAIDIMQAGNIASFCQHLEFFADHPPLQIRPLSAGNTNLSYYIRTARSEYVLRRYNSLLSGRCHQQELRCQHAAAAAGLAPAPLCLNNHQHILISDYIAEGTALTLNGPRLALLANKVARLHNLRVQTPLLHPSRYLRQLLKHTEQQSVEPAASLFAALQHSAEQLAQLEQDTVLCHMDLHPGNLLWAGQKIWMLDFEYAQLADSSFDLAALCLHFQLSAEQQQQLIRVYWQERCFNERGRQQRLAVTMAQRLKLAKILYSGFCWLWYQTMPAGNTEAARWQAQLSQLLAQSPPSLSANTL